METLKRLQHQIPELETGIEQAKLRNSQSEQAYRDAKTEHEGLLETTMKVRLLDHEIHQKKTGITTLQSTLEKLNGEKTREQNLKAGILTSMEEMKIVLNAVDEYLNSTQNDKLLITEFTGIESQSARFTESRKSVLRSKHNLDTKNEALDNSKKQIQDLEIELQAAIDLYQSDRDNTLSIVQQIENLLAGRKPEDIRKRKEDLLLQLLELRKIASLETERTRLEDGKPCPLCGSVHHPFAEGNVPTVTEPEREYADLINLMESHDKLISGKEQHEKDERSSEAKVIECNTNLSIQKQLKTAIEDELKQLTEGHNDLNATCNTLSQGLIQQLLPFGISEIPERVEDLNEIIDILRQRREKRMNKETEKTKLEAGLSEKEAEIMVKDTILASKDNDIESKNGDLVSLQEELRITIQNRNQLFGNKNPEEEEKNAADALNEKEIENSKAKEMLVLSEQSLGENSKQIVELEQKTSENARTLNESEQQFTLLLRENEFPDEQSFLSKRLPKNELDQLEREAGQLDTRKTELKTRMSDREMQLKQEEEKHLTDKKRDELVKELEETAEAQKQATEESAALWHRLESNRTAKESWASIGEHIQNQTAIHDRWARLNKLIGSADGYNYRNFAQELTFEIMVRYANDQLVKLSDRYLLVRDKQRLLEINVIDNYHAGITRSTANLSGGESFIVSLALALGLSRMSSKNVRVDSLFLDEGFGTLDEETLETALATLAGLRQEGKMIGVISHVGAMKERINTKIMVQPIREGRSVLTGPGVEREGI